MDTKNIIANTAANNNNSFDTALENLMLETSKKMESLGAIREEKKAERRKTLFEDTILALVMSSRKHYGISMWKLNEAPTAPIVKPSEYSNKTTVIAGCALVVKQVIEDDSRGHLVIYTQDTEVKRVAGMIGRIKKNDATILTKEETEFVLSRRDMGEEYVKACKALYAQLKKAIEAGIGIRIVSTDTINATPLRNKKLPLTLAGTKVNFKNGMARYQGNILTMDNGITLSGEYELAVVNGSIAVKRDLESPDAKEKMPEAFYASKMLSLTANAIVLTAEGAEDAGEEVAA